MQTLNAVAKHALLAQFYEVAKQWEAARVRRDECKRAYEEAQNHADKLYTEAKVIQNFLKDFKVSTDGEDCDEA